MRLCNHDIINTIYTPINKHHQHTILLHIPSLHPSSLGPQISSPFHLPTPTQPKLPLFHTTILSQKPFLLAARLPEPKQHILIIHTIHTSTTPSFHLVIILLPYPYIIHLALIPFNPSLTKHSRHLLHLSAIINHQLSAQPTHTPNKQINNCFVNHHHYHRPHNNTITTNNNSWSRIVLLCAMAPIFISHVPSSHPYL